VATDSRTLVKSQPELWQLLDQPERMQGLERDPEKRLAWEGAVADEAGSIEIALEKKGWGTQVQIHADVSPAWDGIEEWLSAVFEELAEPERRPFQGVL
jgi:hypothetical protein